jgi:hypothetical protein
MYLFTGQVSINLLSRTDLRVICLDMQRFVY